MKLLSALVLSACLMTPSAMAADGALAGTEWQATELDGKNVDPQVVSTLAFDADGAVHGNGGCNSFRGKAEIKGTALKFGDLASTAMACEDAKSMQETVFYKALVQAASFSLADTELTLLDAAGKTLARFQKP